MLRDDIHNFSPSSESESQINYSGLPDKSKGSRVFAYSQTVFLTRPGDQIQMGRDNRNTIKNAEYQVRL